MNRIRQKKIIHNNNEYLFIFSNSYFKLICEFIVFCDRIQFNSQLYDFDIFLCAHKKGEHVIINK